VETQHSLAESEIYYKTYLGTYPNILFTEVQKRNLVYSRLNSIDEMIAQHLAFSALKILTSQTFTFLPGTLLVIYNMKLLLTGEPELDVKTDKEDILMAGALEEE
jgi:hypothetical protein